MKYSKNVHYKTFFH